MYVENERRAGRIYSKREFAVGGRCEWLKRLQGARNSQRIVIATP